MNKKDIHKVIDLACEISGVTKELLTSTNTHHNAVRCRYAIALYLYDECAIKIIDIMSLIGKLNVHNMISKARFRIRKDSEFMSLYNELESAANEIKIKNNIPIGEDIKSIISDTKNKACEAFGVDPEELSNGNRNKFVIMAKHSVMHHLFCNLKVPEEFIIKYFKVKRTTVLHARKRVMNRCKNDIEFKPSYEIFLNLIK